MPSPTPQYSAMITALCADDHRPLCVGAPAGPDVGTHDIRWSGGGVIGSCSGRGGWRRGEEFALIGAALALLTARMFARGCTAGGRDVVVDQSRAVAVSSCRAHTRARTRVPQRPRPARWSRAGHSSVVVLVVGSSGPRSVVADGGAGEAFALIGAALAFLPGRVGRAPLFSHLSCLRRPGGQVATWPPGGNCRPSLPRSPPVVPRSLLSTPVTIIHRDDPDFVIRALRTMITELRG
jgi:hypothetical protein